MVLPCNNNFQNFTFATSLTSTDFGKGGQLSEWVEFNAPPDTIGGQLNTTDSSSSS